MKSERYSFVMELLYICANVSDSLGTKRLPGSLYKISEGGSYPILNLWFTEMPGSKGSAFDGFLRENSLKHNFHFPQRFPQFQEPLFV